MSLLFRTAPRGEQQRSLSFQSVFGQARNVDLYGPEVGPMRLIPLFAAHRTIIDAVASTPLKAYRAASDGTTAELPRQPPLLTTPAWGTPFTWKAQCVASLLADGNAFGLVTALGADGWPSQMLWLPPAWVEVVYVSPTSIPDYYYQGRRLESGTVVHIPWILPPGHLRGLSPIKNFRVAFEMGQAAQTVGRDWFANGAIPSGHLKNTARKLAESQATEAKGIFKAAVVGRDVLVTGSEWDYNTIGVPADEARFIETLKLSATQIAAIYGVPAEEIGGDVGGSLTYSTVESNEMRFSRRVIRPWAVRIEEALGTLMPRPQYARFNLDSGIRADLKTRMEAHEIGQRQGVLTNAEARRLEDRPPLTDQEHAEWVGLWRKTQPDPNTGPASREDRP